MRKNYSNYKQKIFIIPAYATSYAKATEVKKAMEVKKASGGQA